MEKRGQITLLVIIGIVLLLGSGLIMFISKSTDDVPKPPEDIESIVSYIQLCLEEIGTTAVHNLGQQGGYIYYPAAIDLNPFSYIELLPNSGIKLPYWYYRGKSRVPSVENMQSDINNFVTVQVENCVRNFSAFEDEFSVQNVGDIKVDSTLAKEDVVIKLDFPLKFTSIADGKTTEFASYITRLPVRLLKSYELAKKILEEENEKMYLEEAVLNLMVLDPDIPFDDMRFSCGKLRWSKNSVSQDLKEMLFYNTPRFRIKETKIKPFKLSIDEYKKFDKWDTKEVKDLEFESLPADLPPDMYEYKQLFFDIGLDKRKYDDLEVSFQFNQNSRLDMNVLPSRGDVMDAGFGKGHNKFLRFMCINIFHFTYDVEFPVQVVINDPKAFNGDGFNFRFATPIIIDHNIPNRKPKYSFDFIQRDFDNDLCNNLNDENILIQARDSFDNKELKDVNISFECGRFICPLGTIELNGLHYEKNVNLPKACGPGSILGQKEGWLDERVEIEGDKIILYMKELVPLKLNFMRHQSDKLDSALETNEDQTVIFSLYDTESDFSVYKIRNPVGLNSDDSAEILLPFKNGNYELNIALTELHDDNVIIVGGYKLDNWTITEDDFLGSSQLTFHIYEQNPIPADEVGQLALFNAMDNFEIQQKLAPSIK